MNKKIHKTSNKEILVNENHYKKNEFDKFFANLKKKFV